MNVAQCGAIFESEAAVRGHESLCAFCKTWRSGFIAGRSNGPKERWRDTKITVPCDGDDVIGYWKPDSNFGKRHIGEVHYFNKIWHIVGEPHLKCGMPDFWMPMSLLDATKDGKP